MLVITLRWGWRQALSVRPDVLAMGGNANALGKTSYGSEMPEIAWQSCCCWYVSTISLNSPTASGQSVQRQSRHFYLCLDWGYRRIAPRPKAVWMLFGAGLLRVSDTWHLASRYHCHASHLHLQIGGLAASVIHPARARSRLKFPPREGRRGTLRYATGCECACLIALALRSCVCAPAS